MKERRPLGAQRPGTQAGCNRDAARCQHVRCQPARCQQMTAGPRFALTSFASCDDIESDIDMVEPRQARIEQGAGCCSMPGGRLDDIEMDAVARRALQRPVFGAGTTGDDAQDGQPRVALRASRTNRRSHLPGNRLRHGNGPHSTNYVHLSACEKGGQPQRLRKRSI